ncbi:50S ribosomal protein L3 glutamine methyltransferase [Massilia sp. Bi118]|uniref:methyltransferase n=1 Tax=Massilia sp. Bi118 TaxID=2822346 RepID=UPI001D514791|nr:class I SAM-dependent methyltransferase [Massilia sp. Bi118]CAH0261275.1 50S ribosomal protein L3 glutamine methyltransferase [Massilia sp. Bi118]
MTLDLRSPAALAALGRRLRDQDYRFTTVTPATHRRVNRRAENAWAHGLRDVFGWSRPYRDGVLPAEIDALLVESGLREDIGQESEAGHRPRIRASTIAGQLYFHSAFPTDDDDAVFFGPDTYRYVAALKRALASPLLSRPVRRAGDIGCGAGPAAIELALCCPDAAVYGADINEDALTLTEINAELNGATRLIPCRSNLLDGVDGHFDLVMSNPPYILDPDELPYRHGGGEHGAELSIQIVKAGLSRLHPGGSLLLYTGVAIVAGEDPFLTAIRPLLDEACGEWRYEELDPDIFGGQLECEGYEKVERIAAVWLHAVKRG